MVQFVHPILFYSTWNIDSYFHGRINDALEPEMAPNVPIMENNIRKILNGQKLEKDFNPSIGCSIKWKDFDYGR